MVPPSHSNQSRVRWSIHLFKSPTYGFLVGTILTKGCRPDFNNGLGGDSNSGSVLGSGVYLSPTRIMAPPRATPILCQTKYTSVQVSSSLMISWWLSYLANHHREASLIKKEYCRCGPHPLQVISSRARPPLVKGAGCIGPLFPDFRGWPLWFMASIALRGLQTPAPEVVPGTSLHSEALSPECRREHQETGEG